jgi:hypothetical protein
VLQKSCGADQALHGLEGENAPSLSSLDRRQSRAPQQHIDHRKISTDTGAPGGTAAYQTRTADPSQSASAAAPLEIWAATLPSLHLWSSAAGTHRRRSTPKTSATTPLHRQSRRPGTRASVRRLHTAEVHRLKPAARSVPEEVVWGRGRARLSAAGRRSWRRLAGSEERRRH